MGYLGQNDGGDDDKNRYVVDSNGQSLSESSIFLEKDSAGKADDHCNV